MYLKFIKFTRIPENVESAAHYGNKNYIKRMMKEITKVVTLTF